MEIAGRSHATNAAPSLTDKPSRKDRLMAKARHTRNVDARQPSDMSDRQCDLVARMLILFEEFHDLSRIEKVEALGRTFSALAMIDRGDPTMVVLVAALRARAEAL